MVAQIDGDAEIVCLPVAWSRGKHNAAVFRAFSAPMERGGFSADARFQQRLIRRQGGIVRLSLMVIVKRGFAPDAASSGERYQRTEMFHHARRRRSKPRSGPPWCLISPAADSASAVFFGGVLMTCPGMHPRSAVSFLAARPQRPGAENCSGGYSTVARSGRSLRAAQPNPSGPGYSRQQRSRRWVMATPGSRCG